MHDVMTIAMWMILAALAVLVVTHPAGFTAAASSVSSPSLQALQIFSGK